MGGGNIVIHSRKQRRYKCTCCGRTFSETHGTSVYRLKKPAELFVLVVTLLVHGCPVQAIVSAFGLDERTVSAWLRKAGGHAQQVHERMMSRQKLDLGQVQGDEIHVKTQGGVLWMALAVMVSTRLWLGGIVSAQRDMRLAQRLAAQIRYVALERPLLLAVDGWRSYAP
jgi:transposase-like protein